ncbi:MAG: peptidylprolyl isomerase [Oscillospiraceae bacterium]|jgi:peptidyl-prolyl cis-trans isomerase B (cyclophilin B)|nr:peptidylprolyl isomerase [Oscillospiraceae bacterium]
MANKSRNPYEQKRAEAARKAKSQRYVRLAAVAVAVVAVIVVAVVILKSIGGKTDPGYGFAPGEKPRVTISFEGFGDVLVELEPDVAPITVANFLKLAGDGFYDGLTIHRVAPGFVIQGGDPSGDGSGGSGETIKGEFSSNGVANDIEHVRGVISMARVGGDNDSATSQFFITLGDARGSLDGSYAGFGHVIDGMDVIDAIAAVPLVDPANTQGSAPVTPVVIRQIAVNG